jgi:hypothetical protein
MAERRAVRRLGVARVTFDHQSLSTSFARL